MKIILISSTLLGLCAAAVAAPIGFGTLTIKTGETFQEPSRILDLDHIAPDFDYYADSAPGSLFENDPRDTPPLTPDSAPGVMLMAGLAFFGIARMLRMGSALLARFKRDRRQGRRRRMKLEIRMMA